MLSGQKFNLNYSTQITAADRRTLLGAAVLMAQALTRGGAAMFTRSTPGCGTLDGPSLANIQNSAHEHEK
jgi:hypothetical protein